MGGDMVDPKFGSINDLNFAFGLMARKYVHPNLAIRANALHTRLSANDNRYNRLAKRGFRTETPLTEFSLDFEIDMLGHRNGKPGIGRSIISPYLFAGAGLALTNPKTSYGTLDKVALEDQNAEVSNTRFVLPVGAGLRINVSPLWSLALEMAPRATFSDYLDGVSLAGNPESDDWYGIGSVQLWYRFVKPDRDGDGIADAEDACPDLAGTGLSTGCPDRDNDGVADEQDRCPDIPGLMTMAGCPDSDNDGITDAADPCPTQAGPASTGGCPDSDGDGIVDNLDDCPDEAGLPANSGCPLRDKDKDGVQDDEDECPEEAGPVTNNGCPYRDSDGDGIWDTEDRCPNAVGPLSNGGCPEEKVKMEVEAKAKEVVDFATRNVRFATNEAELLASSFPILDEVALVLQDYPAYHLKIEGFTDSRGASDYNRKLSEARAQSCYNYLLAKGISKTRMQYAGFGESNPAASNETEAGRLQNRRVEFSLSK